MLTVEEKKRILRRTTLFAKVPETILTQVADASEIVSFKAGEIVFEKGDSGTSMYVIVEGQVRAHDGELVFNYLSKGDVFGEMAALDPDVRSASITAEVDTVLFHLDQQPLYDLMSEQIEVAKAVIHVLCQHLRHRVQDMAEDFLYRKALERELEIGREIQAGFLPDALPQVPGWEIATHFQAAREVAGDFYDAFTLSQEEKIGLVIGDVCDKGVGAALFMTLFRSMIRLTSNSDNFMGWSDSYPDASADLLEPQQTLFSGPVSLKNSVTLTNNYIARIHRQTSMFASLFFAQLNPATGSLIYINAGHEAPIILNSSGVKASLEPTGPVVGILPGIDFKIQEVHLEPGDTLLTFSDGVIDALNQDGVSFTEERLLSLLEQADLSATALLGHIEANLRTFTAGADQFDDITMLAVRRTPLPEV